MVIELGTKGALVALFLAFALGVALQKFYPLF